MESVFSGFGRPTKDIELVYPSSGGREPYTRFTLCINSLTGKPSFLPMFASGKTAVDLSRLVRQGYEIFVIAEPITRELSNYNNYTEFNITSWRFTHGRRN